MNEICNMRQQRWGEFPCLETRFLRSYITSLKTGILEVLICLMGLYLLIHNQHWSSQSYIHLTFIIIIIDLLLAEVVLHITFKTSGFPVTITVKSCVRIVKIRQKITGWPNAIWWTLYFSIRTWRRCCDICKWLATATWLTSDYTVFTHFRCLLYVLY